MRGTRTFLDSNILVYASDANSPEKQSIAQGILSDPSIRVVLSTQVLLEFFNAATKKLKIEPVLARSLAESYARKEVLVLSCDVVLDAMGTAILHQRSLWDALILEAAANANCTRVLSEDMQHGQVVRGVRVENPFLA
jgi:predicted nucleic acid-binding protein